MSFRLAHGLVRRLVASVGAIAVVVALAGAGTSPAQAAETDVQRQQFVTAVYLDLFGRPPDPTGLAGWTAALRTGTPRAAVANAITHSHEFRARLITETYLRYLGRGPDPVGLQSWLVAMDAGATIAQISAGFIASDEYYARQGDQPLSWVSALYRDVLGRPAGPAEAAAWATRLTRPGVARATIALGILLSDEHLTPVVRGYYLNLLDRGPDPTGLRAWMSLLQAGTHDEDIIGGIVASDEFWSKALTGQPGGPVAHLEITPQTAEVTAGTPVTFRAIYVDPGHPDVDVTDAATFWWYGGSGGTGTCVANVCQQNEAGATGVVASWENHGSALADVRVVHGPATSTTLSLAHLSEMGGEAYMPADVTTPVTVTATDAQRNTWSVDAMTVSLDGSACAARCGPFAVGDHTLTGVPDPGSGLPAPQPLLLAAKNPSLAGGHAYSWGSNPIGFGDDSTTARATPTPIGTGSWWWHVAAGSDHVLATRTDVTLWTWGDNSHGQLGTGPLARDDLAPTWLPFGVSVVSAFGQHSFLGTGRGWPFGFGENAQGELGNNSPGADASSPTSLLLEGTTLGLDPISTGGSVTAGVTAAGELWIWGGNAYGQLGNGSTAARTYPLRLGTDSWLDVAAGQDHVVAVRSDGTLWQWGLLVRGDANGLGRVFATTPQQVGTATDWTSVSAGADVSAAVNAGGQLWAWGDNADAQLGDGTTTSRATPVRVGATTAWTKLVFGGTHTAAIATDGSLWTWGHDGSSTASVHLVPTRVGTESTWTDVAAGTGFTVALRP